jgi:hypothetical protein
VADFVLGAEAPTSSLLIYGIAGRSARIDDGRTKALRLLAKSESGCTAPIMVRHGCSMSAIRCLVREGLATVERGQVRRQRSWRAIFRLRITGAGRKALIE